MRRRDFLRASIGATAGLALTGITPGRATTPTNLKAVIVGDTAVGKTSTGIRLYTNQPPPEEAIPTVFDNYEIDLQHRQNTVHLSLWDTAGEEDYDRLRPLSYPQTNFFIVMLSVISPSSLDNVSAKWLPEIAHHVPNAPVMIVGNKIDLRHTYQTQGLPQPMMRNYIERELPTNFSGVRIIDYMETSARTGEGVHQMITACLDYALPTFRPLAAEGAGRPAGEEQQQQQIQTIDPNRP